MNIHIPNLFEFGSYQLVALIIFATLIFRFLLKSKRSLKDLVQLLLKSLALACLLAALHEPFAKKIETSLSSLILVDVSDSMNPEIADTLLQDAKKMALSSRDGQVVSFSRKAALQSGGVVGLGSYQTLQQQNSAIDRGASSLETALDEVKKVQPGAVLLISDGHENLGDVLSSDFSRLPPIYPLFPKDETRSQNTMQITSFHAPLIAESGKTITATAAVQNKTAAPQSGSLILFKDGKQIAKKDVKINAGSDESFSFDSIEVDPDVNELQVSFTPFDKSISSSNKQRYVTGERGETVLLINGSAADAKGLEGVLKQQSYELTTLVAGSSIASFPDLNQFSVVILNNANRRAFREQHIKSLERFAKAGGGLLMLGSNNSFGPGRWKDTLVEKAMPLEFVPPQAKKKRVNVAVVLVLDKSRSMASGSKLEYAKEAAREVIKNLKDSDYIGIIGFDDAPFVVVKLGQLKSIRRQAVERVGRLFAAGRTNLYPAADEARRSLMKVAAGRKHVIIMTDGKLPDAGAHYLNLVNNMRMAGITSSTVMLGAEADEWLLKDMAERGGGAFYKTNDPRALPRIFLSDVKVNTGEKTLKEAQEYTVRRGPQGIKSVNIKSFPPLRGYVETKKKAKGAVELQAYAAGKAEPLLASWSYGKGRSAAFTSDANGRWSNYWLGWRKYNRFWTELIDSLRPEKGDKKRIPFDLRYSVVKGKLQLDVAIFAEEGSSLTGTMIGPDGIPTEIPFSLTTIGRYQASLDGVSSGRHDLSLKFEDTDLTPISIYLDGTLFGEQKGKGYNTALLYKLADKTGGQVQPTAETFMKQASTIESKEDKTWMFVLGALIFYLMSVVVRET